MKTVFLSLSILLFALVLSCNNSSNNTSHEGHDMSKDTVQHATAETGKPVKEVAVLFSDVDPKAAAAVNAIIDNYISINHALAADNASEAAAAAEKLSADLKGVDKSLFTAEQKKLFDNNAEDLADHAAHIGKNGDNIQHQREHFSMMSEDVYDLVKAFGTGKPVYHAHCPMYNDGKGAMWLNETQEIRNPYYGKEMLTCGTLEEVIK